MSEVPPKKTKRQFIKRTAIEPNIYPNFKKDDDGKLIPDGTFDVLVSRRMWMDEGKPHGQMFRRKRKVVGEVAARKLKRKFQDELAGEALKFENRDLTWEQARHEYYSHLEKRQKDGSVSHTTIHSTRTTLEKHTNNVRWNSKWISSFTADFIEAFITDPDLKLEAKSSETRLNILKYIRGVFKRQVATGRLKHNPAQGILVRNTGDKERHPETMSHREALSLIAHAKKIKSEWTDILRVAYFSGCRSGELWAMKWENIDFETGNIYIRNSYCWKSEKEKSTKGKKHRTVPMNENLKTCLRELKLKSDGSPYVLPHLADWKNGKAAQFVRRFQKELGIKQTKFHALRGAFITNLLLANEPLVKIQIIVGHSDLKTTMKYLGMIAKETKGATDALDVDPFANDEKKADDQQSAPEDNVTDMHEHKKKASS